MDSTGLDLIESKVDSIESEVVSIELELNSSGLELDSCGSEFGSSGPELNLFQTKVDSFELELNSSGSEFCSFEFVLVDSVAQKTAAVAAAAAAPEAATTAATAAATTAPVGRQGVAYVWRTSVGNCVLFSTVASIEYLGHFGLEKRRNFGSGNEKPDGIVQQNAFALPAERNF